MNVIHEDNCPDLGAVLERFGRRWTGSVLAAASRGARRFGEYRALIEGISDRLLSQRLRELEAEGLIERIVIPSTPVQIRYALTPDGEKLIEALDHLALWSRRHDTSRRQATRAATA